MLNHQSITRSGVPPFIVCWYQKVDWITLNYSVVTKPMSYNSVLFPLTKLLVMVSYGWVLSWFLVYKGGWRILNAGFCLWILWHIRHFSTMVPHMLFWLGFVCISIYGITFGLNLQIFHIIWKSESLWLFSWPIMNTRTWVTSLVCCAVRSGGTSAVIVQSGHISPAKLYQKEADIYMGIVIHLLWAIKITAVRKWV